MGFWDEYKRTYTGPWAWITWAVVVYIFVFFGGTIYAFVQLFEAESTRDQIIYAAIAVICAMLTVVCKLFFYMQMHRNALEDRLKRIEDKLP